MNKLAIAIEKGELTVEELASAKELIERAELVINGIEACKKTLLFPLGVNSINCFSHMDTVKEYESWGKCTIDGTFTCFCNLKGNQVTHRCNLMNFSEVFMAFENTEFAEELRMFLLKQIDMVNRESAKYQDDCQGRQ